MKKTAFLAGIAFLLTISAMAQVDTKTPTRDSIESKYQLLPMPAPLATAKIFPVVGTYQFTGADAQQTNVKISLDEENKGLVWIEGLPEGKIKAQLRKSPATYKIPAQKMEDGTMVAEGTLIYDKDNNQLQLCFGCLYNNEDPTIAFTTPAPPVETKIKNGKSKIKLAKVKTYTGQKLDVAVTGMVN